MNQNRNMWYRRSIGLQLFLLTFGIFLITTLSITLTVYSHLGSDLTRSIQHDLSKSALTLGQKMDLRFSEQALNLNAWATLEVMDDLVTGDIDGRIGRTLTLLKSRYRLPGDIYVFDTKGALIASSNSTKALKQTRMSSPKIWLTNKNEPVFIDKHLDPFKNENVVAFSHAIKASFSEANLGSMVLTYPWSGIENALTDNTATPLILMGEENTVLYADKRFSAGSNEALIKAVQEGASELALDGIVYLVGAGIPPPDKLRFPVGWKITALSPKSVAYEPIYSLGWQIGRLTLMLSVPLALLILLVTRRWVRPIRQLTETVVDITASMDLSKRVSVDSMDEVGLLAKTFNTMTGKLQHTLEENSGFAKKLEDINKNLEMKVAQRTEQYSLANQELSRAMHRLEATQSQLVQSEKTTRAHNRVLELLAKGAPLSRILDAVVHGMEAEKSPMPCSILLLDNEGKHLVTCAAHNLPDSYIAAIDGMAIGAGCGSSGNFAFSGERTIVEDMQTHPDCAGFKEFARQAGLHACWSQPILAISGKVLGTFAVYRCEAGIPTEKDILLMESTANLAGIAIERKNSEAELQLASLVFQNSSEAMVITDANNAILTINPAFTEVTGYTLEEVVGQNPRKFSSGRHDKVFFQAMWHSLNTTGRWQGEIWNRRKNGEIFAEWLMINTIRNADGSVHRSVALFSDITEKKKSDELIWQQANFDALTGLPNRHLFHYRLEQGVRKIHRTGQALALLFLDLDRFKEVNDTLGHDFGDLLLKEAAQRLSSCVRETDTVARLGGDEFTVILSELDELSSVERVTQDILRKLADAYHLKNETVYVSASIGITLYPTDASGIESLLRNADQAMYASKRQGGNRFNYFTPSMPEGAQTRI